MVSKREYNTLTRLRAELVLLPPSRENKQALAAVDLLLATVRDMLAERGYFKQESPDE